ncbi:phosphotransferase [Microlunatus ginsengisoli]|uniref:Aminoglycoside phosphotransferase domain-containing protein n=1 Tax=Microlunatus ginsengisoli TaxID=363863 RepID=A0ABP7AFC5_9ACTN
MRHGYTNDTTRDGASVAKTYAGPGATGRCAVERKVLTSLAGLLPVPAVRGGDAETLVVEFVSGRHGQDLMGAGFAREILSGCGRFLRHLHSIDPVPVLGLASRGEVIVHGDFGPNNVLFAEDGFAVSAVLDWEFCHLGAPVEDLAWCEWIVRAHHPQARAELPSLFAAYGRTPAWADRQDSMVRRCAQLEQFCREWDPAGGGVEMWIERGRQASAWRP